MSLFRNITSGLRSLFRKKRGELSEELRSFLEMADEEETKQGLSREQARRAARLQHGSPVIAMEEVRSAGWDSLLACGHIFVKGHTGNVVVRLANCPIHRG